MPCAVCGEKLQVRGSSSLFRHYLREHPIVAAKTWKCCIPKSIKEIPEVKAYRIRKGWDKP